MANALDAAHTPAVNHPSQITSGYMVTREAAAQHFTSDAIAHGTESRSTIASVTRALGWVAAPVGPGGMNHGAPTFVPTPGTAGVPGANPSYQLINGTYYFSGASGNPAYSTATGASLSQAIANWIAANPAAIGTTPANATPAAATPSSSSTTPFDTLAGLLGSIAGSTPVVPATPDNSPGTAVQTTTGPSLVIPLLLVLLAVGLGYWWFTKHQHAKHAA